MDLCESSTRIYSVGKVELQIEAWMFVEGVCGVRGRWMSACLQCVCGGGGLLLILNSMLFHR